jgi:hypothetical protein
MDEFRARLARCASYEIDLRLHVIHFKLVSEQINAEDIRENLERLKRQDFKSLLFCKAIDRNKFKLYFRHTNNILHKYIIDIRDSERKIRVVTVHKIHCDSQKRFDKYAHR